MAPASVPPVVATNATAPVTRWPPPTLPVTEASVDLVMIILASSFLFLTATILCMLPWTSPMPSRARWATRTALMLTSAETDTLRHYIALPYGTMGHTPHDAAAAAAAAAAAGESGASYETLLDIGDLIGPANKGFTDAQIHVLPSYTIKASAAMHRAPRDKVRRADSCAICRDEFRERDVIRVLPCADEYHADCIAPWLRQQATCPLCRSRFA